MAIRSSQATTSTQQTHTKATLHNDGGAGLPTDYALTMQANYAAASILLRHLLLVPHLFPVVPGALRIVILHPLVLQASTAGETSRGAHQPSLINDACTSRKHIAQGKCRKNATQGRTV